MEESLKRRALFAVPIGSTMVIILWAVAMLSAPALSAQSDSQGGWLLNCGPLAATISGTSGNDILLGTPGPDVIAGGQATMSSMVMTVVTPSVVDQGMTRYTAGEGRTSS